MNKSIIISLILMGFAISAKANIDSLQNIYQSSRVYKQKIESLMSIIDYYNNNYPKKAQIYIKKLEALAKNKKDKNIILQAMIFKAISFATIGNLDSSNHYAFECLRQSNEFKDKSYLSRIYLTLGVNFSRLGVYDKSTYYLLKGAKVAKDTKNFEMLANIQISLGILNSDLGEYSESLKNYFQAEKYFKSKNDISRLALIYINLSGVYANLQSLEKALNYCKLSIKYSDSLNDTPSIAIGYTNQGAILIELKRYKEAISLLNESIKIKTKYNNTLGLAYSKLLKGNALTGLGDFSNAIKFIKEAKSTFELLGLKQNVLNINIDLEMISKNMGDYKSAYHYAKIAQAINDTIFNESKQKIITELNAKYELSEKNTTNQMLQLESNRQKFISTIIIIILISLIISITLLLWRYNTVRKSNNLLAENTKLIEDANIELEKLNDDLEETNLHLYELNAVKDKFFSIIAHDLKSPISTLNQLVSTINHDYHSLSEDERIELLKIIEDSSSNTFNLVQNLLTWARSQKNQIEFNPVNSDISLLINQILEQLKSIANAKNIDLLNNIVEGFFISVDINLFSTILRNLISNAIKYTYQGGKVIVSLVDSLDDKFIFSVKDTGIGIKPKLIDKLFKIEKTMSTPGTNLELGTGLGLILCKEFLEKHGGTIWVESKVGEGSTFYFSIKK